MSSQDQAATALAASALPLFYREPILLSSQLHVGWRLKGGDASFAAEAPHVPIVVGELAAAASNYPIVFAANDAQPIAILGLERRNLFVEGGRWAEDAYVPAYVRRYPFGFVATTNPDGFALAIDGAADRVVRDGEEGVALFEDGQPSALTREAMEFCTVFGRDAEMTRLFAIALKEKELLIDRRADATLPDGRKLGLDGFQIVDAEKFAALDGETLVAWHRQGLLGLIHHHLASLDRFQNLLARQARLLGGPDRTTTTPDTTPAADLEEAGDVAPAIPKKTKKA
jgi:hypothetical protein